MKNSCCISPYCCIRCANKSTKKENTMPNYPDGFNADLLVERELPDSVQDDLTRIEAAHAEIMSAIRCLNRPIYNLDTAEVTDFIIAADQMFGDLVAKLYKQIEADTGIYVDMPMSPEQANWLRKKSRPAFTNPQTIKDVEQANRVAALSVFDSEDRSA
jgi:hypothetical protein